MGELFSGGQVRLLEQALSRAVLRQEALANNVANADTPGFKRQEVCFPEELRRAQARLALARSHSGHLGASGEAMSARVTRQLTSGREDGNNVDLEYELASLAENSLWYQAVIRQLGVRFQLWRTVITEGRG